MARQTKAVATEVVVEGLRGIEERIEGLLETFEIISDKKLLENVKRVSGRPRKAAAEASKRSSQTFESKPSSDPCRLRVPRVSSGC